jgi:hypothetical protein
MRGKERAGNKKPARPQSGERVFTRTFVAAIFSDRILAPRRVATLAVRSQVGGLCIREPLLMPFI